MTAPPTDEPQAPTPSLALAKAMKKPVETPAHEPEFVEPEHDGPEQPPETEPTSETVKYVRDNFQAYNAARLIEAADGWIELMRNGGSMFVTLAGAMSTAQIGRSLAPLIRAGRICGISCTGANLEEDLFNLVGYSMYEYLPHYATMKPSDEDAMAQRGMNRVTDAGVPDEYAVKPVADAIMGLWQKADQAGERYFPHEFLYQLLREGTLEKQFDEAADPSNSWMLAAAAENIPIVVPGWEDSTLGNQFAAACVKGDITDPNTVRSGIEYMMALADWYPKQAAKGPVGFFQIGGGIAGDFPICVVPMLKEELKQDVPFWSYFCQITDADVSYGGYSGAMPPEKQTWEKLDKDTPSFVIKSDATIVAPLIFKMVLEA